VLNYVAWPRVIGEGHNHHRANPAYCLYSYAIQTFTVSRELLGDVFFVTELSKLASLDIEYSHKTENRYYCSTMSPSSLLFLLNACLTLPVGVVGLFFPGFLFSQFGADLDPSCKALVRGYMSTLLGYGSMMAQLRSSNHVEYEFLVASAVFNLAETVLQMHAVVSKAGFNYMIWSTISAHGVLGVWSLWNLSRHKKNKKE